MSTDPAHIRALCDQIHDALTISEHPPAPKGGQGGSTSASRPPMPITILDAKEDLKAKLVSWARMIGDEANNGEGIVINADDDTHSIAAWIYTKADWLGEHPAAEDFIIEISEAVKALRRPYLTPQQMRFCGEHQGERIYVPEGQETATLPDGSVERTVSLMAHTASRMQDVIDTPKRVAEIIQTFHGFDITAKQITTAYADDHNSKRQQHREPLEPAMVVGKRNMYRVSDVMRRFGVFDCMRRRIAVN